MAFQFLCPQGHLLQADPSQMGQSIHCPTCGVLFVVPTVARAAAAPGVTAVPPAATPPAPPRHTEEDPGEFDFRKRPSRRFAHLEELPAAEAAAPAGFPEVGASDTVAFSPEDTGPKLVHVACPAGHELITPLDTMGQEVLCPHCGEQFRLRYEDTREYKSERFWKEESRQQKLGQSWLTWAVVVGVVVLLMLVGMIVFSLQ